MNWIITALIAVSSLVGGLVGGSFGTQSTYDSALWRPTNQITLGATSFPTSLDSLTNPGATDSVATVSHSGQHSNANDAIEAIEAKVGTGASTPIANTVFIGNGVGSSAWSASPTLTDITLTNLLVNGSSTLQSFTFTNATGTNATTTTIFSTTASSTNVYGAGLATCQSGSFLTWSAGSFGCDTDNTGSSSITSDDVATSTSNINLFRGPYNVVAGDKFLIWAKMGVGRTGNITLTYKQGTDAASTTLDYSTQNDDSTNGNSVLPLQGFYVATTTTTVSFGTTISGGYSNPWSSLIVLPLQ